MLIYISYSNGLDQYAENTYHNNIFAESYPPQMVFTPNAISSEIKLPSTVLSNEKSQQIFDLVSDRLIANKHPPVTEYQNSLLEGDRTQDFHIMSRTMMQSHIDGYWQNFHSQLPICI
jgi:hypothetical protein